MKMIILFSSAVLSTIVAMAGPADAKGCLKGAVAGGAVGHYAGHHGLIGAAAGCFIGRHEAAQRERERENVRPQGGPNYQNAGPSYR